MYFQIRGDLSRAQNNIPWEIRICVCESWINQWMSCSSVSCRIPHRLENSAADVLVSAANFKHQFPHGFSLYWAPCNSDKINSIELYTAKCIPSQKLRSKSQAKPVRLRTPRLYYSGFQPFFCLDRWTQVLLHRLHQPCSFDLISNWVLFNFIHSLYKIRYCHNNFSFNRVVRV